MSNFDGAIGAGWPGAMSNFDGAIGAGRPGAMGNFDGAIGAGRPRAMSDLFPGQCGRNQVHSRERLGSMSDIPRECQREEKRYSKERDFVIKEPSH
jgi:hypothetical protein